MSAEAMRRARRAYELGRLRGAAWRAACVCAPIGAVVIATAGAAALPITYAAWMFAFWRGDRVLRGSFYGLLGGLVTALLPMSVLRPCCTPGMPMNADCCTMPGACLGAGAFVGMMLAAAIPFGKATWWRTAMGMALGMTSIAVLRCVTLFAGEALGLLGGLVAGVAAMAAARSAVRRA